MSLLFCVLGIFLMARPKSSVKMLCVLMGIMLILYGAIKISGYFTRDAFLSGISVRSGFRDPADGSGE